MSKEAIPFNYRPMSGVTLLEILMVLTISAVILISSIRYYESATNSLQANSILEQVQVITASIDHYTAGTFTYEGVNTSILASLLPEHILTTPWGTDITLSEVTPNSYTVTLPATPAKVCTSIMGKLVTNKHFQITSSCHGINTDFIYTYYANL